MSGESGSVQTRKTTVSEARKALSENLKWLWITLLVLGSVGVAAYVVGTVLEEVYGNKQDWTDVLLIAVVPFTVGLIFIIAGRSQKKADLQTDNIQTNSEFFSDCIILREFKEGEQVGVIRLDYNKILSIKQRGSFIYLTIATGISYPVFMGGLTEIEVNTVKKYLNIQVDCNVQTLELRVCDLLN